MHPVKLQTEKLWDNGALLPWAIVAAFVLCVMLFGAALVWSYVADEFYRPSLNEASYPPPRADGR
jgi:hypothetical protein